MKFRRSKQEAGYVAGIQNAVAKGRAHAENLTITEEGNPYRRYEHRTSWLDGFRKRRKEMEAEKS